MTRLRTTPALCLFAPQLAWASDPSGLLPFYIGFVLLVGGFLAGFEWMLINAVLDRLSAAGDTGPEPQNMRRFGCKPAMFLWAVNSLAVDLVLRAAWG